ncbi:MAG TPA: hypothetical protein VEI26_10605 [Terriglobales bacterium]|nr:hypothetical protein [Terriglobales bacterium]
MAEQTGKEEATKNPQIDFALWLLPSARDVTQRQLAVQGTDYESGMRSPPRVETLYRLVWLPWRSVAHAGAAW